MGVADRDRERARRAPARARGGGGRHRRRLHDAREGVRDLPRRRRRRRRSWPSCRSGARAACAATSTRTSSSSSRSCRRRRRARSSATSCADDLHGTGTEGLGRGRAVADRRVPARAGRRPRRRADRLRALPGGPARPARRAERDPGQRAALRHAHARPPRAIRRTPSRSGADTDPRTSSTGSPSSRPAAASPANWSASTPSTWGRSRYELGDRHRRGARDRQGGRGPALRADHDVLRVDLDPADDVLVADVDQPGRPRADRRGRGRRVDVLVNNAGITRDARIVKMTEEHFLAVIRVNLGAAYELTRACTFADGACVVSLASRAYLGNFGQFNYSAVQGRPGRHDPRAGARTRAARARERDRAEPDRIGDDARPCLPRSWTR